jgi:hypothetical protein
MSKANYRLCDLAFEENYCLESKMFIVERSDEGFLFSVFVRVLFFVFWVAFLV